MRIINNVVISQNKPIDINNVSTISLTTSTQEAKEYQLLLSQEEFNAIINSDNINVLTNFSIEGLSGDAIIHIENVWESEAFGAYVFSGSFEFNGMKFAIIGYLGNSSSTYLLGFYSLV